MHFNPVFASKIHSAHIYLDPDGRNSCHLWWISISPKVCNFVFVRKIPLSCGWFSWLTYPAHNSYYDLSPLLNLHYLLNLIIWFYQVSMIKIKLNTSSLTDRYLFWSTVYYVEMFCIICVLVSIISPLCD